MMMTRTGRVGSNVMLWPFTASMLLSQISLEHTSRAQCTTHHGNGTPATTCCRAVGPDIIIGQLGGVTGTENYPADKTHDAFSFDITACNVGNQDLTFNGASENHPVYAQNLYKLKDGVLHQIGMSWIKHVFASDNSSLCDCDCVSSGQPILILIAGCSDAYAASQQGDQPTLGPRWEVNAFSGEVPNAFGLSNPPFSGETARRLRVALNDLEPSGENTEFFAEIVTVSPDDANAGNRNNNASYCTAGISQEKNNFNAFIDGATHREQAAIRAWGKSFPGVVETDIQVPGEGLFILAARVTNLGGGQWHYEYAIENLNSDRSGASFSIPLPDGAVITNIGFHDVDYHSGDAVGNTTDGNLNIDGTDWIPTVSSADITWQTAHTFSENENANALRWATMYNFSFDANRPPHYGEITLGLFKPGKPASVTATTLVPVDAPVCYADIAPQPNGNGTVNVDDLLLLISFWGPGVSPADIAPLPDGNGTVNVDDLLLLISQWGPCGSSSGACCLPTGSCISLPSLSDCLNVNGSWKGIGSSCGAKGVCIPDNDECSGAVEVFDGDNLVSNGGATLSTIPGLGCATSGADSDVWFTYTAPYSGVLTVNSCSTSGLKSPAESTVIAVYDGDCSTLSSESCEDGGCSSQEGIAQHAYVEHDVSEGETYVIRVGTTVGSPNGQILLRVLTVVKGACCFFGICLGDFTERSCDLFCGSSWEHSTTCSTTVCIPPQPPPASHCSPFHLAGNNSIDASLATSSFVGYQNGNAGFMDDAFLCNGGGSIDDIRVTIADGSDSSTGTLSTYTQFLLRIYDLGLQPISSLDPRTAVPLYENVFEAGDDATKTLCGTLFSFDLECWTLIPLVPIDLPEGEYGIYFSFPELTTEFVFMGATGVGSDTSPDTMYVWGIGGDGEPINVDLQLRHASFCLSGQ